MAKEVKEPQENLELELLKAKLALLETKVTKPQTAEEDYAKREALYDSKASEREALRQRIEARRMEIMMMPELMGKARMDEVILLESWERRSKSLEKTNPNFSIILMNEFKRKIRDIKQDVLR